MFKLLGKIISLVIILVILIPVFVLAYLGFIPGLSSLFGANKPRDLGIKFTEADRISGRGKSQIEYGEISGSVSEADSWQTSGSRPVKTEFSNAEATAIMNNKPGKYFPYKNVQLKFNADGSGEISGTLIKNRIPLYAATFDAPKVAVDLVMKFLPENPVFYLKGQASLKDNRVALFQPQRLEIGRLPVPLGPILSFAPIKIKKALALDIGEFNKELSKVSNKKTLIIDFINSRLAMIEGFFAQSAYFEENKLVFEGNLPEKEVTVR